MDPLAIRAEDMGNSLPLNLNKIPQPDCWALNAVVDDRGILGFIDNLDLGFFKRMYFLTHHIPGYIRAWFGTHVEGRLLIPLKGAAMVCCAPINVFESEYGTDQAIYEEQFDRYSLTEKQRSALWIPKDYVHGIRTYNPSTELLILSTATVEESHKHTKQWDSELYMHVWDVS